MTLSYTDLGELIVFRLTDEEFGPTCDGIFPTYRKALNYFRRHRFPDRVSIQAVRVFPGKMDSERVAAAERILDQARRSPGSVAQIHLNNAYRIISEIA